MPTMPAAFTFGIELEYLVPYIFTGDIDPEPKETRVIDRSTPMEQSFRNAEGIVIDNVVYNRVLSTLQFAGLPAAKMPKLPIGALPTQWSAVADESLTETDEMEEMYGNCFVPLELVSPVLSVDRASFRSIRLAVDAVVSKHRLFPTESCGYHVHVGRGTEGFTLPVLKNIAAFVWTFELQLSSLHPRERHSNGYACSMRLRANISHHAKDLSQGIREIYTASDARRLVHLIHWTEEFEKYENDDVFIRNMAYNFVNIVHAEGKKTIEFRQACSTTDSLDVKMWAEICVGIVMACAEKGEAEWSTFLLDAAGKEQKKSPEVMKIGELLRKIGLSDQAGWAEDRSSKLKSVCSVQ